MTRRTRNDNVEIICMNEERISFGRPGMFKLVHNGEVTEEESEMCTSEELNSLDSTSGENFDLFLAVSKRETDGIWRALQGGSDINGHSVPMGITVLHIASSQGDEGTVTVLLKAGADPKAADKLGRTPIHMAASVGSEECLQLLLKAGASTNVKYHVNTLPRTDAAGQQSMESKKGMIPLETLGLELPFPDCWERTPLHQAAKANSPECVQMLLEAGAEVDPADECGMTPLLLAGNGIQLKEPEDVEKYEEIVDILLSYGAKADVISSGTGYTALHVSASHYSGKAASVLLKKGANPLQVAEAGCHSTAVHLAAELAASDVLNVILKSTNDDYRRHQYANVENEKGSTPLHLAAYAGCHTCVSLLIEAGADLGAVTQSGITALDSLFLYLPRPAQFLSRVLDGRIRPNAATVEERSFAIQLDFRVLAPHGNERQTGVMRALLEAESASNEIRRMLLIHPVVEAFIVLKWRRLRLFFYLLVTVYVIFAISLSVYITLLHSETAFKNFSAPIKKDSGSPESDWKVEVVLKSISISRRILMVSSSVVLLNVFGQCVALPRYYLKQFEMWMNLISAILAVVVAREGRYDGVAHNNTSDAIPPVNVTDVDERGGVTEHCNHYTSSVIIHLTSVAILLAWAELMLLIGRFPMWGSHGLLFYAVLKNVLKVLLAFGCLVIGFAFSFFVQFHRSHPDAFGDPWRAFVKTMVMMMGEFEYLELFKVNETVPNTSPSMDHMSMLMMTSRVIFVFFVVLASIVLVNLMVGLAVSDTQALRSEGEARRLLKQAEFVAHLERGVAAVIRTRWLPRSLLLHLSKRRAIDTVVVVRPSDSANAPAHRAGRHLPRRLLEDLVAIALRRREAERKRTKVSHSNDSVPTFFVPSSNDTLPQDVDLILTLQNISKSLVDIKDMLEPRFGIHGNPGPSVLRVRKWSSARTPRAKFSDLVAEVTGAQSIIKRLSRSDKSGMERLKV